MMSRLLVRIVTKDGRVVKAETTAEEAESFADCVAAHGFLDSKSAMYVPPAAIARIEVGMGRSREAVACV